MTSSGMRLGVSSYTYVWAIGVPGYPRPASPMQALDLLHRAASLDVRVLQIADNLPLHAMPHAAQDALFDEARVLGIEIELGTRGIDPERLDRYTEIAERAGATILRTLIDDADHRPDAHEAVALLRASVPALQRAGVTLAIENHDRLPAATLAHIVERVGSPHVAICLDTANSLGCLEGTATVVETLGPHTVNLHVKDCIVRRLPHEKGFVVEGCPAGQGQVDVPAVLARLAAFGRSPNVIVELWPPPELDVEASVMKERGWAEESVEYLRRLVPR